MGERKGRWTDGKEEGSFILSAFTETQLSSGHSMKNKGSKIFPYPFQFDRVWGERQERAELPGEVQGGGNMQE